MIVFLLTPPLQLTIPKVTIFHPPWLLVYGTIQASRDSISGETLKTHWGDDIFLFWRFKISQVYFRNFSIYSNLQKHEQCFQNGTSIMFSILSESGCCYMLLSPLVTGTASSTIPESLGLVPPRL